MTKNTKNIGIKVEVPKEVCRDKKCPFHGNVTPRGKTFVGIVLKKDTHNTATIEWAYRIDVPKFERTETRRTKIRVHNPSCINAQIGDIVKIVKTRPLSKTKNFVIIESLGKEKGFIQKMEAREEAKVQEEKEEEPEKKEAPSKKKQKKSDEENTEEVEG